MRFQILEKQKIPQLSEIEFFFHTGALFSKILNVTGKPSEILCDFYIGWNTRSRSTDCESIIPTSNENCTCVS